MAELAFGNGLIKLYSNWNATRDMAVSKSLDIQYLEYSGSYEIFAVDNQIAYTTTIFKGTVPSVADWDQSTNDGYKTDFETSYKSGSNQRTKNTAILTGSSFVTLTGSSTVTGSLSVLNTVTITGSVGVNGLAFASGALAVFISGTNTQPITGTVTIGSPLNSTTGGVKVTNIQPDSTQTGTLNALNAAITIDLSGSTGIGFQLAAGTLVGTIIAEISYDGGTTWATTGFYDVDTKGLTDTIVFASSNTAQTKGIMMAPGAGLARVRVSAFTSGTASGTLRASQAQQQVIYSAPLDGRRATYSATSAAFTAANNATDIFTIYGSATKVIRVLMIEIYATQTTAGSANIFIIKRSATNTGGTSATLTNVPFDSFSTAATATVRSYTANPSALGASVGNLKGIRKLVPAATTVIGDAVARLSFGDRPGSAVVLRNANEGVAVNLNGVTVSGNSFVITVEWTEE